MQIKIEQGLQALKENLYRTMVHRYESVKAGIDPDTQQPIYVDCTVGADTYRMNAGMNAANTFDQGLRLAAQNGEATTFVVDFYDQVHENVPLADAQEINRQQSLDARVHYQEKQGFKAAIAAATIVVEVKAINIVFSINIL
jgi:cellobiose phosphorylase